MDQIKNNWPYVSKEEKIIINNVLKTNKLNFWTGKKCKDFEKKFSKYFKRKYSISFNSGSVALDAAIRSLNLKPNSEVIVTPRSYISSATCVLNNDLKPIFSDISFETQNIELEFIKKKITKKTKAIVVVHLGGMPANIIDIVNYAKKKKIKVIEDCSQAHGAKIGNRYVGSFGDIAVWSFCNDKIINTLGEGGMLSTNNKNIYEKAWSFRDCGKNLRSVKKINNKNYKFKWLHDFNGSNYRLTEIQAAVGNYQLQKLNGWVKKRNLYAYKIKKILKSFHFVSTFRDKKGYLNSYYRLYVKINNEFLSEEWNAEKIINELNRKKIKCNFGACPTIYKEKLFIKKGYKNSLKNAEKLKNNTICFIIHPNLGTDYFYNLERNLNTIFRKVKLKNVK